MQEIERTTKSGSALRAEISASVIEIEGRSSMIALVRDIEKRKVAEPSTRPSGAISSKCSSAATGGSAAGAGRRIFSE